MALALPWLESLEPRGARAQGLMSPRRFVALHFPCGAPQEFWAPALTGQGAAWQLSGILEPFAALKEKIQVLGGLANFSAFTMNRDDNGQSHGRMPGAFLTCADVVQLQNDFNAQDVNGISVDQVIAQHPLYQTLAPLPSLELSVGTSDNSCDGPPCSYSRAMSWKGMEGPNLPLLDPGLAFDRVVGANTAAPPGVDLEQVRALNQSVLDYVHDSATALSPRLGQADRAKVEEFLTAVRGVERRVIETTGAACQSIERPTLQAEHGINANVPGGYDKATHVDLMNDLIVMAFQCDTTRVVTELLENERSEFLYDFVPRRTFSGGTSTEIDAFCGNYHGASAGLAEEFATIIRWEASKVAELCARLDQIEDGPGVSVLDNSVVYLGSCMEGPTHRSINLPIVLLGSLGGVLKTDQHVIFENDRPLRDLYFTLMNQGFDLGVTDFGSNRLNQPLTTLTEILA